MQFLNKIFLTILILLFFSLSSKSVFAHALDVGYLEITPQENQIKSVIKLPWNEIISIAEMNHSEEVSDYQSGKNTDFYTMVDKIVTKDKDSVIKYLLLHLFIFNNKNQCQIENSDIVPPDKTGLLFGGSITINLYFNCKEKINQVQIENTILFETFPLQSHIMTIANNVNYLEKIFNKQNPIYSFTIQGNSITISKPTKIKPVENQNPNQTFVEKIFNKIFPAKNFSLLFSILLVFVIGVLHSLEPGHSKNVIAALMTDKLFTRRKGIIFAIIFTITHLSDIIILGSLLLIIGSFTDIMSRLPYLEKISAIGILIISLYLIQQNIKNIIKNQNSKEEHHHDHEHLFNSDFKKQIAIAFLSGLSPCLMGWSIFFVMLNLKKTIYIFPIIFSFGLGIFFALFILIEASMFLKKKLVDKVEKFAIYFPLISSLILFLFALLTLINFSV
jgi:ABC-type nickel/cobalt efflux system permease component RcnA